MKKKILVTAGTTLVMIDKVRGLTNIFTGKTGTNIAINLARMGHKVVLLTSDPTLLNDPPMWGKATEEEIRDIKRKLKVVKFKTYQELKDKMETQIRGGGFDAVIHSAAVSDFYVSAVYVKGADGQLMKIDSTKKIPSRYKALYPEMLPTEKIIDLIRVQWNFAGCLVKFKLEVGISDSELIEIAKNSRDASDADFMVANCLEWSGYYAYVIGRDDVAKKVSRKQLPKALDEAMETFL